MVYIIVFVFIMKYWYLFTTLVKEVMNTTMDQHYKKIIK